VADNGAATDASPTADASSPTAEASAPRVDPSQPTAEASVEASQPTAEASESTAEASEPTVEASEPAVEAPEPTVEAPEPTTYVGAAGGESDAAAASPEPKSSAEVQFMVTNKMKEELKALGYDEADVTLLQPERAAAIITRSIKRPPSGVPDAWNRSSRLRGLSARVRKFRPAVMSAVRLPSKLQSRPAAFGGLAVLLSIFALISGKPLTAGKPKPAYFPTKEFEVVSESPFWIDRQLDKLEAWLKNKLTKNR